MTVRTIDTNPAMSSEKIREILTLENEIDKHLLKHLINGKTSYLVTASERLVVDMLISRYQRAGWSVVLAYTGTNLFRLEFEDIDQVEITRKYKTFRPSRPPPPVSGSK